MGITVRKYIKILFFIILIIIVLSAGIRLYPAVLHMCRNITENNDAERIIDTLNNYYICVDFNPFDKTLNCKQSIKYYNTANKPLSHIYFHLYPNAFKSESKPAFPPEEMDKAYPNGFSSGSIDIKKVTVAGREADYVIEGYSDNLLSVLLDNALEPAESVTVEMEYIVAMPDCMGRFGYGDKTYKAANWYPIAAVYDDKGWALDPYYSIGDPFYSQIAHYSVEINAPENYIIASTGENVSCIRKGSSKQWKFEASFVRDFAWVASNEFKIKSKNAGDTTVISYYLSDDEYGEKALDSAIEALLIFNKKFGEYPYKYFSVVECSFFIGGMEYPNLVMIDSSLYSEENLDWLELVVVHETAHQWWYGLVGNDQINEAWLDEALTEYSTVIYYGARYGKNKEKDIFNSVIAEGKYNALSHYVEDDEVINRAIYEFKNWIAYDILVYGKGAMMFHEIRDILGDKVFFKVLREYCKKFKYKIANSDDMIKTFSKISGRDLSNVFNKWLYDEEKFQDADVVKRKNILPFYFLCCRILKSDVEYKVIGCNTFVTIK